MANEGEPYTEWRYEVTREGRRVLAERAETRADDDDGRGRRHVTTDACRSHGCQACRDEDEGGTP